MMNPSFRSKPRPELFEPDILLPSQWAARHTPSLDSPERKLMAAVLEDALRRYHAGRTAHGDRSVQIRQEVWDWLHAEDYDWPFSARNICDTLGVSLERLRASLPEFVTRPMVVTRRPVGPERKMRVARVHRRRIGR